MQRDERTKEDNSGRRFKRGIEIRRADKDMMRWRKTEDKRKNKEETKQSQDGPNNSERI